VTTGTEFPICTHDFAQSHPAIDGDLVVWKDWRNGDPDIYGYDLSRGIEFPIYVGPGEQSRPAVSGNLVVWNDWQNGDMDIWGAYVPEPATLLLLTCGCLALLARRQKRPGRS